MKRFLGTLICLWAGMWAFSLPTAKELSTRELVGQTIMPRVVIGHHKPFKKAVQNAEVTGFFIKAFEGNVTHPHLTAKNQEKFIRHQRQKLLKTITDLQTWAAQSPHQIPLLLAVDYEGGTVTSPMYLGLKQMPSNMLLAATQDEQLVRQMYAAQAGELRALGIYMSLGPDTDVNSNPQNPVIQTRSFGDNSARVGRFALAAVEGLQHNGVAAVPKHFPGHGDTEQDSHLEQPVTNLPLATLWKNHIGAFTRPLQQAWGVMTNHVVYPSLDAQHSAIFSPGIIGQVLRGQLHYNGLILTDGLDMDGVGNKSLQDIVLDGYAAGNDILLLTGKPREIKASARYPRLAAQWVETELAQKKPRLSRKRLEQSVERILEVKARLAHFTPQTPTPDFEEVSRQVAKAGVTLVRDRAAQLPLQAEKICAVFFADDIFSEQLHSFADELTAAGRKVAYLHLPVTPGKKAAQQIQSCMEGVEAVVVGTSRKGKLDPVQFEQVQAIAAQAARHGQSTVLVSLLNPYEIPSYDSFSTVLAVYGPTAPAMQTVAQIIAGSTPAKGVLPVVFVP